MSADLIAQLEAQRASMTPAEWAQRIAPLRKAFADDDAAARDAVRVQRRALVDARTAAAHQLVAAVRQACAAADALASTDNQIATFAPTMAEKLRHSLGVKLHELDTEAFTRTADAVHVELVGAT